MSSPTSIECLDDLSLVRDDLPFRWQQRIGLIPRRGGLGIARRAIFWSAIAWIPVAVWAWWASRALPVPGQTTEPLLQHFGVHARLLFGIPLLIIAEAAAQQVMTRLVPQFVNAGVVQGENIPRFRAILADTARLRDAVLPWAIIVGLALAWAFTDTVVHRAHELSWATEEGPVALLGFGGWWYVHVSRPIFVALLLGWLWRLILLEITFKRIARLDLVIVPTHADRFGGLGFVERFPAGFSLVALVPAVVVAAGWAHDAEFHGLDVHSLYPMMAAGLAITLLTFLSPYLALVGPLIRAKKQALLDYGALVARRGAEVRRKWILGETGRDDPLLSAPEIGPVADTVALYEAVQRMRPFPLGRTALLAIALPVAIPFVCVLAIQVPIKELLGQLAKALL
jgi:hypothetical protein